MKAALHIPNFNYGRNTDIAPTLIKIIQKAEEVGFDTLSVMDHYFQIPNVGPNTDPMLEAYTTLSYMAAHTKRIKLGALVTGVIYRQPAFLIKQVNTLDVLSEGRAFFGIGAAWNEEESKALGFNFPVVKERFERLEDVLRLTLHMWKDETDTFQGKFYHLPYPMNHPLPITRPHPPILIGGGGEKKTLLLVAKYANACNLFGGLGIDGVAHKLDILREHCKEVGRNYDDIEKTAMVQGDVRNGVESILNECTALAKLGIQKIFFMIPNKEELTPLDIFGKEIISQIAKL